MSISIATLNIVTMAYKLTCTFFAIYYSIVQAQRYFQNEDASIVSFKPFNQQPKDNYPDLTFCIQGGQFKKGVLDEFQVSAEEFSSILKGAIPVDAVSNATAHKIVLMDTSNYFTSLKDIIHRFSFKTNKRILDYDKNNNEMNKSDLLLSSLFSVTHQEPDWICFTRHGKLEKETLIARKEDYIMLDFSDFWWELNLKIYLHQPGQLIQHLMSPSYQKSLSKASGRIDLNVAGITILRKRSRKSAICHEPKSDDGMQLMTRVVKDLNCMPGYWSSFLNTSVFDKICSATSELQSATTMIQNEIEMISKGIPPCIAMLIPFSMQEKEFPEGLFWRRMHISIRYSSTEYQEIVNVRGFDFDSMFSGIGGFVGIFLGYSLLQVADILNITSLKKLANIYLTFLSLLWKTITTLFKKGMCLLFSNFILIKA